MLETDFADPEEVDNVRPAPEGREGGVGAGTEEGRVVGFGDYGVSVWDEFGLIGSVCGGLDR